MSPSESPLEKDKTAVQSTPAVLPDAIKDSTQAAESQVSKVLDAARIIDDIEKCLLVPHPREAYLASLIVYLKDTASPPPASQYGIDVTKLLQHETAPAILSRFETLLASMKPIPDYLRGAINYLRTPTHSIADINRHANNIGKVWILEPRDPAVVAIHHHFRLLQYQFHRTAFEAAVSPDRPQDIMNFFTSYLPLSQLQAQFTRDGHPQQAEEIVGMLNHEMRLKAGVQVPEKAAETQNTAQLIADAESFLDSGALTNEGDKNCFTKIVAFLRSPTEKISDIKKHSEAIGNVLSSFFEETPEVLDAINRHFMGLLFGHHFKELKAAVAENPQSIQRVTNAMREAIGTAKYSDATVQQELNAYLQAHEIRKKR